MKTGHYDLSRHIRAARLLRDDTAAKARETIRVADAFGIDVSAKINKTIYLSIIFSMVFTLKMKTRYVSSRSALIFVANALKTTKARKSTRHMHSTIVYSDGGERVETQMEWNVENENAQMWTFPATHSSVQYGRKNRLVLRKSRTGTVGVRFASAAVRRTETFYRSDSSCRANAIV